MKHHIFLSYRRADREITKALVTELRAQKVTVWWDEDLDGGVDWRDSIVQNLSDSDMLVILFSAECNASKQLRKELAIADYMDKVVVPVLIEDTVPKGHFLYELASRNWIQIHPEAMTKVDRLVEKLVALVEEVPGRLRESPPPADPVPTVGATSLPLDAEHVPSADFENPDLPTVETTARPVVEEKTAAPIIKQTVASLATPPPPSAAARASLPPPLPSPLKQPSPEVHTAPELEMPQKGGSATKTEAVTKALRDLFPFRRIDLVFFPLLGAFDLALAAHGGVLGVPLCLFGAIYCAFNFPVRYYQRQIKPRTAVRMIFVSTLVLIVPLGMIVAFDHKSGTGGFDSAMIIGPFAFVVTIAIAMLIYAIASAQRALRRFRSNVEKL